MRQVVQDLRSGAVRIAEVPEPPLADGFLRVRTAASAVSPGTERALLSIGRKSLLGKARARPDLVKKVWTKMRRDGLVAAARTVRDRLAAPLPLGYSAAGTVLEVGRDAGAFVVGDRVACAGAGFANHAEEVVVPKNLAARVPQGLSWNEAATGTLGAIALNAVRVADCRVGDRVAVVGAGVLGTLAARIARAGGVSVLAVDPSPAALDRVRADGAALVATPSDAVAAARAWTDGAGVDAVVVAAASPDEDPMGLAAEVVRRAGVVVALGDVPLSLPRRVAYAKEVRLAVATSYGPGRYDRAYEEGGRDYPLAYVRWTAGRNLSAFLALVEAGSVRVEDLLEPVAFDDAVEAYGRLVRGDAGGRAFVFAYPASPRRVARPPSAPVEPATGLRTALLGAGAFGRGVLWPALAAAGATPSVVAARSGASAAETASRLGFGRSTTDARAAARAADVDLVVIATPHDSHADLAAAALEAGKHVFVEKPLAIDEAGLEAVVAALRRAKGILSVGFNRRWSPFAVKAREFLAAVPGPSVVTYRVNAGSLPGGSWLSDESVSGGRIVGEACHMVDLAAFLCGSRPARVAAAGARRAGSSTRRDDAAIVVEMEDGSVATIAYHAVGDPAAGKERVEVARGDRVAVLDDFRALSLVRDGRTARTRASPDKGHAAGARAFVAAARAGGPPPIPYDDLLAVTRATFAAVRSLASGRFEAV